jgi:hypothetical protein
VPKFIVCFSELSYPVLYTSKSNTIFLNLYESLWIIPVEIIEVSELKHPAWNPFAARAITSFSPPEMNSRSPFDDNCSSPKQKCSGMLPAGTNRNSDKGGKL